MGQIFDEKLKALVIAVIEEVPNHRVEEYWDDWHECWDTVTVDGRSSEAIANALFKAGVLREAS